MARRRKSEDPFEFAAQLFGLGLALAMLFFGIRSPKSLFSAAILILSVFSIAGLLVFLFIRFAIAPKAAHSGSGSPFTSRHAVSLPSTDLTHRIAVDLQGPGPRPKTTLPVSRPGKLSLMHQLQTIDLFQFEKLVALAYRKHGYSVSRRGGANPDGGIDLLIGKDGETRAVQCKQWKKWKVKLGTVRDFLGAMVDARINRGLIITLCGSTRDARDFAARHNIQIFDASALTEMLLTLDPKHDPDVQALLTDQRKFCPKCEQEMVLRPARRGVNVGKNFWGCSTYPRCQFTMPADEHSSTPSDHFPHARPF